MNGDTFGFCLVDYAIASAAYHYEAVVSQPGRSDVTVSGDGVGSAISGKEGIGQLFANFG